MASLKIVVVASVFLATVAALADECPCKIIATIRDEKGAVIEQKKYPLGPWLSLEGCNAEKESPMFKDAMADLNNYAKQLSALGFKNATADAECKNVNYKPVKPEGGKNT